MTDVIAIVGAGGGVGRAVAQRFGRQGYVVALLARDSRRLDLLAEELEAAEVSALPFPADASDVGSIRQALQAVETTLGAPTVLHYNAVHGRPEWPTELEPGALQETLSTNVTGALTAAQSVVPAMRLMGRGSILLTGGGWALNPAREYAAVAIGKAAMRALTFSLAKELEHSGIHVATVTVCGNIEPGTPFAPDAIAEQFWRLHRQPEDQWETEVIMR